MSRDITKQAGQGQRSRVGQIIFNWVSNDEVTYNAVQALVTDAFEAETDIIDAGAALRAWVEEEAADYKETVERARLDRRVSPLQRDHQASIFGLMGELLDYAIVSMSEADWQVLAADLLQEPWRSAIRRMH